MTSFKATKKQQGFYRNLTGQWLPNGCSKSKASSLIKKAMAGEMPVKRPDVVSVYGWQFTGLAAECLRPEFKVVKYAVDLNYQSVNSQFATLAEAEAFARARFPEAEITVSNSIRGQYMD